MYLYWTSSIIELPNLDKGVESMKLTAFYAGKPARKLKNASEKLFRSHSLLQQTKWPTHTFPGGIHPQGSKELTNTKPVTDLVPPDILICPLSQHIGAPAKACVKAGDYVKMGQKIGEADGFVSANIHAPVSGKVMAVEPRMHPTGVMVESVVIENDRRDTPDASVKPYGDWRQMIPKQLTDIIFESGIVGMGGAAFPTHVKLTPPPGKKIDHVIINGAECEPYLTADHRVLLEDTEDVLEGLKILMHIFGLKEGFLAVEKNKPDAIERLCSFAEKDEAALHIVPLKTKYPQGSEKQLISAVAHREVPPGKLPLDVGVVVNNVDTCAAIARAVRAGMPLTERVVTVSGDCVRNPGNYRVRFGTPFAYLLEQAGGFANEPAKVIMGGPMMGIAVPSLEVPVIKGTSGVLAFSPLMIHSSAQDVCLRCGKCVSACPMRLMPNALNLNAKQGNLEKLEKLHIMDCMECGTCSYLCPAHQHPVQSIKIAKEKIKENKKKAQK